MAVERGVPQGESARKPASAIDIPQTIAVALAHHRAGRLGQAEAAYRDVLAVDAANADALNLLGAIAHQQGRHREAVDCIRRAIEIHEAAIPARPPNPHAYNNLGEVHRALGNSASARACYQKALAIRPDYAEAHYHIGLTFADEGRDKDAIACYRKAIALNPALALAQYNLGVALKGQGRAGEASACFEQVLRLDPDNELAKFSLAALTAQNPSRPPDKYIANLFDHHAPQFDAHLVDKLRYRVPQDLVELARQHARQRDRKWDVLDLGCGTGLVGAAIAPFARAMVGVDLSARMLGMARARNLYQRLERRDLVTMMKLEPPASYDVIVAADVFIYVGDLAGVVREAARLLRADGILCVSVEALVAAKADAGGSEENDGYRLQASGRYAHSADYLRTLARASGFGDVHLSPTEIRLERGNPVSGWLAILAK
jgi:predicted TPR repeat methyltransferase